MTQLSAEDLAHQAVGNVEPKHLSKAGGLVRTFLYDGPLIQYLYDGEQPHFVFSHIDESMGVVDSGGERTSMDHEEGLSGKIYLLISDRRLIYVGGMEAGDEMISWSYEDIADVGMADDLGEQLLEIQFQTTDGKIYEFPQFMSPADVVEGGVAYISQKIDEKQQETSDTDQLDDGEHSTETSGSLGSEVEQEQSSEASTESGNVEVEDRIRELQKLHSEGLLSSDEFEAKKKQLLDEL